MDNKVAFITGAGSGLGKLYAQSLLEAQWQVAALDVNAEALETLADSPNLLKLVVDVTDADAVAKAAEQAERILGPIVRSINAAAIMPFGRLLEQDSKTIRRIMDINYNGLVNVAAATIPGMLARGQGDFVSFASLAGHVPNFFMGAYNASKFAVVAYTEVLYQENRGQGVNIVCVCPPAVNTPLLEQGRATHWPKSLDVLPPMAPQVVIDSIEKALKKGDFWVFPGFLTKLTWWQRRFLPALAWWQARKLEGL